jgi:CBS domain containing-hemolysin-like protein
LVLAAILVVTALILVNAVYVAAEFAAVSARTQPNPAAGRGGKPPRLLADAGPRDAGRTRPLHRRLPIGITVSGLVLGAYAEASIAGPLRRFSSGPAWNRPPPHRRPFGVVLLLLTVAQVIFAELVPESARAPLPDAIRPYARDPDGAVDVGVPAADHVAERDRAGTAATRRAPPKAHRHIHSPEEIELLIAESRDGGLLEPDEHRRLRRALRLNLRQAKQLMVPRPEISPSTSPPAR